MDFRDPPRRLPLEPLLPMINVVFLLLIFFLMAAQLRPPEAFEVTPPSARAAAQDRAEAQGEFTLLMSADGLAGYRDSTGEAALTALAAARDAHCAAQECDAQPPRLTLRADARLSASALALMLPRLQALGFARIELVARTGGAG